MQTYQFSGGLTSAVCYRGVYVLLAFGVEKVMLLTGLSLR